MKEKIKTIFMKKVALFAHIEQYQFNSGIPIYINIQFIWEFCTEIRIMHINKISNKFFSLDCYSSVYLNLNLCASDTSIMFTLYSKHASKCKNATHTHILYGCRWIKIRHYTIVARSFGRYINALCRRTPKLS